MYRSGHVRGWILTAAATLFVAGQTPAQTINAPARAGVFPVASQNSSQSSGVKVVVRWGSRPGVSRYRLQLAADRDFTDILSDRVVSGTEYWISDLPPGRYFWRVAALTAKSAEYSSTGILDVAREIDRAEVPSAPQPRITPPIREPAKTVPAVNSIITGDGWRAAIGDISRPLIAHLRSTAAFDLVGVNNDGVAYALDAATGVALWTARAPAQKSAPMRNASGPITPLLLRTPAGLDNVIVLFGNNVTAREGRTGRVLWSSNLPTSASAGAVIAANSSSEVVILDSSRQRWLLLDGKTGALLNQAKLQGRVVGLPLPFDYQGTRGVMMSFDDGRVEIADRTARVLKSGDAGSPATTAPLFVVGPRGGLVLVGTRSGLTAFSADDLRALGRVAVQDDAPRGALIAADLDGDGVAEVIMLTDRGRLLAINAADGKTLWQADVASDAGTVAFADLNRDHVLDVLIAGGQSFAVAFSGRDGAVVWKDDGQTSFAANHAIPSTPRAVVVVPFGSGALVISSDPMRLSLRAVEFPRGTLQPILR